MNILKHKITKISSLVVLAGGALFGGYYNLQQYVPDDLYVDTATITSATIDNLTFVTSTQTTGMVYGGATRETKTITYNFSATTTGVQTIQLFNYSSLMPNESSAQVLVKVTSASDATNDTDTYAKGVLMYGYVKRTDGVISTIATPMMANTSCYNDGVACSSSGLQPTLNNVIFSLVGLTGKNMYWNGTVEFTYQTN